MEPTDSGTCSESCPNDLRDQRVVGIVKAHGASPTLIPWAWGINGAASVLGSILTMVIAVNLGFNQALIVAIGLYITAIVFLFYDSMLRRSERRVETATRKARPQESREPLHKFSKWI